VKRTLQVGALVLVVLGVVNARGGENSMTVGLLIIIGLCFVLGFLWVEQAR
jgi:hypothetical protein